MKLQLFLLLLCCTSTQGATEGKKPNIIIMLMDDMGWFDIGANGKYYFVGISTPGKIFIGQEL